MYETSDHQLVKRACEGDQEAWKQLHGRYYAKMLRIALRILEHRQDAEDAVQEAWVDAYLNIHKFRGGASFSTWINRIVSNWCLTQRQKAQKRSELAKIVSLEEVAPEFETPDQELDPLEELIRGEMRARVWRLLSELPDCRWGQAIEMRYYNDMAVNEIAEIFSVSRQTIGNWIREGRRWILERLREEGVDG